MVIRQASGEPFITFLNCLPKAIEWQVDNLEGANILTKQLAYENANQDCKDVMKSIYHKMDTTLSDMIKACQNIGTETHKAALLAAALKPPDKLCYNCRKPGHLQKHCKAKKGCQKCPDQKCPRCQEGFH